MGNRTGSRFVMGWIVRISLACLAVAPAGYAQQFKQPVVIHERLSKGECRREALETGARQGLEALVIQEFDAPTPMARRISRNWNRYLQTSPKVDRESVSVDGGVCRATVLISVDAAKVGSDLAQSYECRRPVAVLARMRNSDDSALKRSLSIDSFEDHLVASLSKRGLAVIDVSELSDDFRRLRTSFEDCAFTGDDQRSCVRDGLSFSETITQIIWALDTSILMAADEEFRSSKLAPLRNGGVLLAVTFDVSEERMGIRISAAAESRFISDNSEAWAIQPRDAPGAVRRSTKAAVARDLAQQISVNLAQDIAKRCSATPAPS